MDIKISKSARRCFACECPFAHGGNVHSLVRVAEDGLRREDYCAACWNDSRGEGAYSAWTLVYADPEVVAQAPPEVFSPLRQLFYEALPESDDRVLKARCFLAAQLLRRQKAFRLIKEGDAGDGEARLLLFADRIGNRLIEVQDPHFTYAEMEAGRKALLERLQELEQPAKAEEEPHAEQSQKAV